MTAQQRNRAIVILLLILVILALFWIYSVHAQVFDVPPMPAMAEMHDYQLVYIARSDTSAYAEWFGNGEIVRAFYLDEYDNPLYWVGGEWFGFSGSWDPMHIPDSPARLQDRALWATYWQVVYILDEMKQTLPRQPLTFYEPETP